MKIVACVAFILALGLLPVGSFIALAAAWLALAVFSWVARVGPVRMVRSSFVALPFAAAAAPLLFTKHGDAIGTLDFGFFALTATWPGLYAVLTIVIKSWVSVQAATMLVFTTRFHDLMHGFERLRLPRLMVAIISLMYRYLAVLTGEASRMMRARAARSAMLPGAKRPPVRWQAGVVGNMVGALFLRSYERSERVYVAMQARGYDGTMVRHEAPPLGVARVTALGAVAAALAAFELVAFLWLPRP